MNKIYIDCPDCSFQIETEPFKNAYCSMCDKTHEADTLIEDIIAGTYEYRLTGKSTPGIVPNDHIFL